MSHQHQASKMDDNDPASGLSAAMAGMTVEARSSAAVKKNVWQTRMEEQQQQRIAKERARARAEAEAEARAGAMKMVMMRERERQEEEEASSRRREQQQQAMHQQQQGHASWDMHRPPPQHQQGYPVGRIGHAPLHHARAKGPPASSPWSHYGGYTNAYNQPMAYPSNGHSHSSRSQPGRRSDGLSHHNGHLHSPSVPAWNTPLSYASRDIPPSPQETESMHVHDVNAHYRMLREQNHRQNSRDFSSQLNNYILQVLLPPILLQEWQMNLMEQGRRSIELIAQSICPGAALVPFGSVVNGLALRNSDLDLCLVLDETYRRKAERTETRLEQKEGIVAVEDGGDDDDDEEEEEEEETPRQILEKLGKKIRKQIPYLYCQYKTHARIPIIKLFARRQIYGNGFGSKWNSFNSDISVGNLLAIWNTRLLKHYCIIDERFKHLVLFLKIWTSRRKINEAFHGTLSSYGWSLMALHFCMYALESPLLPNLQDIERPSEIPEDNMVEGYDIYFFNDLSRLKEHFTTLNTISLGSLIIEFFQYYSSTFDFHNNVISVKTAKITKVDKGWEYDLNRDHNFICIEDPFKTDYNVGRVVQNSGFELIRQELQRAKDILQHAQETNQSINMMINHLLEPGEGIVKKRLKIRKDGEPNTISQQQSQHEQEEQLKKGGGRKAPVPPGSGMLDTFLPVLQSVIRADEFPELVSTHAQSTNAEIPGS